ncbi:hypothetical protein [Paenibacillus gansuensis]|uniref:Uncharacterized protein n=1 Tax=Paenibacillus gansuensis TaxID=306542 RepID=A0ABW5PB73_9BACL
MDGNKADWKLEMVHKAVQEGIIKDPEYWLAAIDEPMPAWAVLKLLLEMIERFNPPYQSYD